MVPGRSGSARCLSCSTCFVITPTISALYKNGPARQTCASPNLPDRMIVTFFALRPGVLRVRTGAARNLRLPDRSALRWPDRPQLPARRPRTPTKRSVTASWAFSPASPRPACSAAFPTAWTPPFPRTSTLWKPRSTRPPSPISCWSSSRQEVPSVPSRTRRSSTWWRSTTGILSLESPCSRTAAERPGGTPRGQRTTAMSMTTGSACCSIQASSRVTPRLSAMSLGQGIS